MSDALSLIVGALTALTLFLGLISGATKYVLLPWLRTHLIEPVTLVRKQVTENHHSNETPTLPDRIDDLSSQMNDVLAQVAALARMFDGHLDWSEEEVRRLWRAIDEAAVPRPRPERD